MSDPNASAAAAAPETEEVPTLDGSKLPDGKILIAGQDIESDSEGGFPAIKGWTVVKLDPETLNLTEVVKDNGESPLQNASVAIEVDGTLWIGSFRADRIAYKDLNGDRSF